MNPARFLRGARRLYTYRNSVRPFLLFCENPILAFSGTVQPEELTFLAELVRLANSIPGPIVEVGTLFGFTTQHIAACKSDDKELITIDNFCWNPIGMSQSAHRAFCQRALFYVCKRCRTRVFDGTNTDFYRSYDGQRPSMVFVDASHQYDEVVVDIKWAIDDGIPIICGHDYCDNSSGVKKAVDEFFGREKTVVGTLWAHVAPEIEWKRQSGGGTDG